MYTETELRLLDMPIENDLGEILGEICLNITGRHLKNIAVVSHCLFFISPPILLAKYFGYIYANSFVLCSKIFTRRPFLTCLPNTYDVVSLKPNKIFSLISELEPTDCSKINFSETAIILYYCNVFVDAIKCYSTMK